MEPAIENQSMQRERRFDTVIVGLGKTGLSCIRHLAGAGSRALAAVDSRTDPPGLLVMRSQFPGIPVHTGGFDEAIMLGAARLLVSPGVSLQEPAIRKAAAAGVEISGDIELFLGAARRPVIAVTGSNGKSTVATLVDAMVQAAGLKSALGGNIGTPALDLLAAAAPDYYVLELSSFQLETVRSLNAAAAAVLNLTPDHMDRYPRVQDYAAVKQRIYEGTGIMVLNLDDPMVCGMRRAGRSSIFFSLHVPQAGEFGLRQVQDDAWLALGEQELMPVSELRINGTYNVANALAALALGHAVGLSLPAMCTALRNFPGLPHRCQWLRECGGVDWYNDSKGTNVGAACAAIGGLAIHRKLVLIAGGDGKGAEFGPLADAARGRVRAAVLIGRDAARIGKALEAELPTYYATRMDAAVETAARLAQKGDAVLLSPACASFDMFENYERRGEAFAAAVHELCRRRWPA